MPSDLQKRKRAIRVRHGLSGIEEGPTLSRRELVTHVHFLCKLNVTVIFLFLKIIVCNNVKSSMGDGRKDKLKDRHTLKREKQFHFSQQVGWTLYESHVFGK